MNRPAFELIGRWSTRIWIACSLFVLPMVTQSCRAGESPPNILLMTVDNLGYGDLSMYNDQSKMVTPALDRLAEQGVRLTSFYTASPTCTVSRACLLTGRVARRHCLTQQLPGLAGNYGIGLRHSERLIPQYLKLGAAPYRSGCFGKWNIGFAKGSRPTERGFDEFIGHASGNMDYYRHNYRSQHDLYKGLEPLKRTGDYASDIFAEAAIDFIRRGTRDDNEGHRQPWFCYLAFNAPHFPTAGNKREGEPNQWQAPDDAFAAIGLSPEETNPNARYRAVVFALDRAIGRVLDALADTGQDDHTFVFLMSDNGAFRLGRKGLDVGVNTPLRSGGVTCWEGGLRVAALARWPRHIKANTVNEQVFWSPDLLILCLRLAGIAKDDVKNLPVLDGKDPLPLLCDGADSPHHSLYFEYGRHAALRMGKWKIVRERPDAAWQLFDLSQDISESHNLAAQAPRQRSRLIDEFERKRADAESR